MQRKLVVIIPLLTLLLPGGMARGNEIIQLLDKTKIVGKLLHFYDGVLSIELPNGSQMKLPASKVARIQFKLPKPRSEYSSPEKTFQRMRKAALKGDLATYVDCHSTYYQMFLNHSIEQMSPSKFSQHLKKEMGSVQLEIMGTKKKKNTAVMKFKGKKGDESQEGEARFIKENKEWKMILPL
jgi:hypothetical protein